MSAPARHATFPLDCDAYNAANKKVRESMANDPDESDPNRRIRTDGSDERYREMWMDAYIEAGGEHKPTPQRRKPGQPVTTCQAPEPPKPAPGVANLSVVVADDEMELPVPGAVVTVAGKGGQHVQETPEGGIVDFQSLDAGEYDLNVIKSGFQLFSRTITVRASRKNIEIVRLKSTTNRLIVIVTSAQDGEPLRGAQVTTTFKAAFGPKAVTERNGRVLFHDIESGKYHVSVTRKGFRSETRRTEVKPLRTTKERIELRSRTNLIVKVVVFEDQKPVNKARVELALAADRPIADAPPSIKRVTGLDGIVEFLDIESGLVIIRVARTAGLGGTSVHLDLRPDRTERKTVEVRRGKPRKRVKSPCCILKSEIAYWTALSQAWTLSSGAGFRDKGEPRTAKPDKINFVLVFTTAGWSRKRAEELYESGPMTTLNLEQVKGASLEINKHLRKVLGPGGLNNLRERLKKKDCIDDEQHELCKTDTFRFK